MNKESKKKRQKESESEKETITKIENGQKLYNLHIQFKS